VGNVAVQKYGEDRREVVEGRHERRVGGCGWDFVGCEEKDEENGGGTVGGEGGGEGRIVDWVQIHVQGA
jgi:hypothetical protein